MCKFFYLWFILLLFILKGGYVSAQDMGISGVVVDEADFPLPGVSVRVKHTSTGTVTDVHGKFNLNAIGHDAVLVVSFVGKRTVEVQASDGVRIKLYPEVGQLEEAVVQVAYGRLRRDAITGAVSSVGSDEIDRRPVTNVTAALEGAMAGVQVYNTYGQPGNGLANDGPVIRIRGFGSVNGVNDPLYVVDGIPYPGGLSELNPADVESVSVLKDASAAALYGNRAANGVILITTKRAASARLSFDVTVRQGIYARGIREYDCVNTDEFMEVMWKSYRNSLLTSNPAAYPTVEAANAEANTSLVSNMLGYNIYNVADAQLFDAEGHLADGVEVLPAIRGDLDWFGPMERKGYRQEYTLSGGAVQEKGDYRFSLGYLNEEGFLKNAGFDRLSARLQMNHKPKEWLKFGMSLSGNHLNQQITDGSNNSFVNVFNISRYMAPIYPVHLHDGETGEYILDKNGNRQYDDGIAGNRKQDAGRNIVWENELNRNKLTKNVITSQAYADLRLPMGFTFTLKGDLYLANQERNLYYNNIIGDGQGAGRKYRYQYRYKHYAFQEQLNWKHRFGEHLAEVLLAHENYYYNYEYTALYKTDQVLPDNPAFNNFTTMRAMNGYPRDYRTESYLGRVRYRYGDKYMAEVAFRRDGSSRFHPDHRWGNFGSVGVAWVLSEEAFMKEAGWLDHLKLRFSYGEVGNDASVGYYGWMSLYKIAINGGEAALYKSQNTAEDIQWETSASYDAAVEMRLFGRWNVTLEYFDKRSDDLLFDVSLPLSSGSTSTDASEMAKITRNLGSVSNRGVEVSTDVDVVRHGAWRWNVGVNATLLKNKILTLPGENRKSGIFVSGVNQKYMEGHSIYEWWLPCFAGVDRLTGNSLYLPDLENYYVGEQQAGKKVLPESALVKIGEQYYTTNTSYARKDWCGSALPKVYGSFSSQLMWKGLSLSALFTYSMGGKVYDQSYASLMATGNFPRAVHRDILKSWDGAPEGMGEDSPDRLDRDGIPVVNADLSLQNNAVSSRFLVDGSYLWVKNIALSYNLPASWTRKLDLQGIGLNLTLENVALFTKRKGMNPQQSFTGVSEDVLVAPRVISVGVRVEI